MRVILAALFVFGSMLGTVGILSSQFGNGPWPWWSEFVPAAAMLCAIVASLFIFNRRGFRPELTRKTLAERVADLEQKGLLDRRSFRAVRAFGVDEFEDEGLHYFVELVDGHVLFLSGQYLYDFEPISAPIEEGGGILEGKNLINIKCPRSILRVGKRESYVQSMILREGTRRNSRVLLVTRGIPNDTA